MIGRNDECWCGSGQKWKKCHFPNSGPTINPLEMSQKDLHDLYLKKFDIILKSDAEIEGIRRACQVTSKILDAVCAHAKEGMTTLELDEYC